MKVLVAQSCSTLCDHMDYSLPGSSAYGILQARILVCPSQGLSNSGIKPMYQTQVSSFWGRFFTIWATRKAQMSINVN